MRLKINNSISANEIVEKLEAELFSWGTNPFPKKLIIKQYKYNNLLSHFYKQFWLFKKNMFTYEVTIFNLL